MKVNDTTIQVEEANKKDGRRVLEDPLLYVEGG